METKKALVLSGGSIRGAFQAGAIKEVLNHKFAPQIITGVSVGALNGAYLCHLSGAVPVGSPVNWPELGNDLLRFWRERITRPHDVADQRRTLPLVWQILKGNFQGLLDTTPIDTLVGEVINPRNVANSGLDFYAGALNMHNGEIEYADKHHASLLSYIRASKAIPIMMPHHDINGVPYLDGGMREVAPLKKAIEEGANEIICILCHKQSNAIDLSQEDFNAGNLLQLSERLMSIVVNELVNNDIERAMLYNEIIQDSGKASCTIAGKERHPVKIKVIRPGDNDDFKIDIKDFDTDDINKLILLGERVAQQTMAAPWLS